jgi:hypothetical protein
MPTVLRVEGFTFKIFHGDHHPPHVHVWHGGASAVVEIVSEAARYAFRMNDPDLRRAQKLVREHRDELLESWLAIQARTR